MVTFAPAVTISVRLRSSLAFPPTSLSVANFSQFFTSLSISKSVALEVSAFVRTAPASSTGTISHNNTLRLRNKLV